MCGGVPNVDGWRATVSYATKNELDLRGNILRVPTFISAKEYIFDGASGGVEKDDSDERPKREKTQAEGRGPLLHSTHHHLA